MDCCKFTLKVHFNIFILAFICGVFFTQFLEANVTSPNNLDGRIQLLLNNPSLKNVSYGISVVSIKKNTPLFSYRDNDLFCIASNMKLLTTAAALEYLGQDFEYKTSVEAHGIIKTTGELDGDIIVRGSGDPNLSGRFYKGNITAVPESWASAVKNRGIHMITGDIIADDRVFDRIYTNPNWPENQLSEWYCAPSCGLSFNDNCVDITLVSDKKPGNAVMLSVDPNTSYFTIFNNCISTSNKKEHAYSIYRKPGTNQIFIKGKFWINASPGKSWVNVQNPALYLATVFKEILGKNGITVQGNARVIDETDSFNSDLEKITETVSTMKQSILVTNKNSQNFYAEQILKTLGSQIKGKGSSSAGIEVLHAFMSKLGFSPDEYQIEDGSGLSKGNKLSPRIITTLLTYMSKHPYSSVLYGSLPVSGIDGGLRRRMVSSRYKNKIHAKTGYIAKTSALSGYIDTLNGDTLAFSILMNNFKDLGAVRKIQDNICQILVDCYN
ncbi:MAG: D-alanyl-D-alanine carboxypeptidase/D-alanyl-D-alanine-endopeptidase [Planctomycetes bacterium]|nr:D-alanyl-D-alanine carboxypeptidase/D-alanyl-D-alanine-endopeptidase [Planctomycetota bacterium]